MIPDLPGGPATRRAGGSTSCFRYLSREVAADIGPELGRMQAVLDNLEAALDLGPLPRYSELGSHGVSDRFTCT